MKFKETTPFMLTDSIKFISPEEIFGSVHETIRVINNVYTMHLASIKCDELNCNVT